MKIYLASFKFELYNSIINVYIKVQLLSLTYSQIIVDRDTFALCSTSLLYNIIHYFINFKFDCILLHVTHKVLFASNESVLDKEAINRKVELIRIIIYYYDSTQFSTSISTSYFTIDKFLASNALSVSESKLIFALHLEYLQL